MEEEFKLYDRMFVWRTLLLVSHPSTPPIIKSNFFSQALIHLQKLMPNPFKTKIFIICCSTYHLSQRFQIATVSKVILCIAALAGSAIALLDWGMHQVIFKYKYKYKFIQMHQVIFKYKYKYKYKL